jgi:hypothetical protein
MTADPKKYVAAHRGSAIAILAHVVVLFTGFTVLGIVFDFPDVLRRPAVDRLTLYTAHQPIIQATYWFLAMTGLTQIAITGFLFRTFRDRDRATLLFALIFGCLCGLLQAMGFIRWAVLIPYLGAELSTGGDSATMAQSITLLEGSFNRYAGMALGEHLANICLGLWTLLTGVALLQERLADRRLGWSGIVLGVVAGLLAAEQLGIAPTFFAVIVDFGFPAWAVWLLVLATSLLKTSPETGRGPDLGWKTATGAVALYALMVLPVLLSG